MVVVLLKKEEFKKHICYFLLKKFIYIKIQLRNFIKLSILTPNIDLV
jgi:hypothetical protein